jgi:hypothetical protein
VTPSHPTKKKSYATHSRKKNVLRSKSHTLTTSAKKLRCAKFEILCKAYSLATHTGHPPVEGRIVGRLVSRLNASCHIVSIFLSTNVLLIFLRSLMSSITSSNSAGSSSSGMKLVSGSSGASSSSGIEGGINEAGPVEEPHPFLFDLT